jgi:hypothetical protein
LKDLADRLDGYDHTADSGNVLVARLLGARRSIGILAAWGVAEGDVSGAEGQFADPQVGDVFGQLSPRSVEADEVGDDRCVQLSHPRP